MADKKNGLLLVMMEIDPEDEDEFNRWYNTEHVPERLRAPGFISGRRFRALEGTPKYLAMYELESPDVLQSEEYKRMLGESATEWTLRMRTKFRVIKRNVYVEMDMDG